MTRIRRNNEEDFDLEGFGLGSRQALVTKQVMNNTCYRLWLDEEIKDPVYYREHLEVLETASENDFIYIHIDSIGGSVGTAVKMINAIRQSNAQILGVLENRAYSAGSLILLACPSILVKPYSTLMAHSVSAGTGGEMAKMWDYAQFLKTETDRLIEDIYSGFLSKDEINSVKMGHKEIWLKDVEVIQRLDGLAEYRRSLTAQEEEEVVTVGKPTLEFAEDSSTEEIPVVESKPARKPRKKKENVK
jgi:ATP-dependent protease ClpP protease subunit